MYLQVTYYLALNLRKLSLRGTVKQSPNKWQGQDSSPLLSNNTFHFTKSFLSFCFHSTSVSISVTKTWGSLGTSNTVLLGVCNNFFKLYFHPK